MSLLPNFEIVLKSPALGDVIARRVFANFPGDALDEFLDTMEPHGVKRTGPDTATFLAEVEIEVVPIGVPMYASAGNLAAPGREMWRR